MQTQQQQTTNTTKRRASMSKQAKMRRPQQTPVATQKTETAAWALPTFSMPSLAVTLGVVSIALGASELLLTKPISKASGLDDKYSTLLRAFGLREISSGVGLLTRTDKNKWLWSRVIGDVMDSAFLGWAFFTEPKAENKKKIAITFAAISPIVLADIWSVWRSSNAGEA